tara:strand:- start:40287 stop:40664 length:378 start_codon:yes stop_codon:yes gene_type:complete
MTDISKEAVDRWEVTHNASGLGFSDGISLSKHGNFVSYDDYRAQAARIAELEASLITARDCLSGEPEYHQQGMGCGVEDRCITDRYEAAAFGWDQAMERVYGEHINDAVAAISAALIDKEVLSDG